MEVSIISRRGTVPESIRRHAHELLQRLERIDKRPTTVHVYFDSERGEKKVETRVTVAGGGQFIAHGAGSTYRTALDQAVDRLMRQVRKDHERSSDHQATKPLAP
jgi:ribosomal subunit interface protein